MNETVFVSVVSAPIGGAIAVLLGRLSAIDRRLDRLSRLNAKVDALLRHAHIEFDEVKRRLVAAG